MLCRFLGQNVLVSSSLQKMLPLIPLSCCASGDGEAQPHAGSGPAGGSQAFWNCCCPTEMGKRNAEQSAVGRWSHVLSSHALQKVRRLPENPDALSHFAFPAGSSPTQRSSGRKLPPAMQGHTDGNRKFLTEIFVPRTTMLQRSGRRSFAFEILPFFTAIG